MGYRGPIVLSTFPELSRHAGLLKESNVVRPLMLDGNEAVTSATSEGTRRFLNLLIRQFSRPICRGTYRCDDLISFSVSRGASHNESLFALLPRHLPP